MSTTTLALAATSAFSLASHAHIYTYVQIPCDGIWPIGDKLEIGTANEREGR